MSKDRVGIVFGGKSGEHEVSLLSAASVIRAIDKEKHDLTYIGIDKNGGWYTVAPAYKSEGSGDCAGEEITADIIENGSWIENAQPLNPWNLKEMVDFALPIVHGPYCEDGKLQGFFEILDMPYGGCGVLASAVAMDKITAKQVFRQNGLPVCKDVAVSRADVAGGKEEVLDKIESQLGYPCFVKPANLGSSVGISKAADRAGLDRALTVALEYDRRIIVEEFINCREVETGVIGNDYPQVSIAGEILPSAEFYDYQAKYLDDGASKLCLPANLPEETAELLRELAAKAYAAIDGEGFARVDFFIDKDTGSIFLNEINTIPGFTRHSMFPLLWAETGLKYDQTIERIIELGYERYNAKNNG